MFQNFLRGFWKEIRSKSLIFSYVKILFEQKYNYLARNFKSNTSKTIKLAIYSVYNTFISIWKQ